MWVKAVVIGLMILLLGAQQLFAQRWAEMMESPEVNLFDLQREFDNYWQNKPYEKGKGWKAFKRYEYFVEQRVWPGGDRSLPGRRFELFQEYLSQNAQARRAASGLGTSSGNWSQISMVNGAPQYRGAGRLNFIAFHPVDTSIMWVGAPGGGLWKSTNGGQSWSTNHDQTEVLGVSHLVVDPQNHDIMYIATGDCNAGTTRSIGVLKSTNGGSSWAPTGLVFAVSDYTTIGKLLVHPVYPDTLFAATTQGVFRSGNGGADWAQITTEYALDIEFKPNDPSVVYASGFKFFRSDNSGSSFTTVALGNNTGRTAVAVTPANPDYVYLLSCDMYNGGFNAFYRSADAGNTFTVQSTTPNILGYSPTGSDTGGQGWYDIALAVSPDNPEEVLTGGINVWRSLDGGSSWVFNESGSTNVYYDIHAIEFKPGSSTSYYAACDGGLFFTSNSGTSWTDMSSNLEIGEIYRIGQSATDPFNIIAGHQDLGIKHFNGTTWMNNLGGDGMECMIDPTDDNFVYASAHYGGLARSSDGGLSYILITPFQAGSGAWTTPWTLDPANPQVMYAAYSEIWKSEDRGDNWTSISSIGGSPITFRALAVAPSNSDYIYASKGVQLYRTNNGGQTWDLLSDSLPSVFITSIAVHPTNPDRVWITYSSYNANIKVFTTDNGGTTWTNVSAGLPNLPVNSIVYENGTADRLYIGTDVGVYTHENGMAGWEPYFTGLPNVIVQELEIYYPTRQLRAATFGRGLWESDLAGISTGTAAAAAAGQNLVIYPNPFSSQISFYLPEQSGPISYQLTDMLGRQLLRGSAARATLEQPLQLQPEQNLPKGIYLLQVQSAGRTYVQKLVKE